MLGNSARPTRSLVGLTPAPRKPIDRACVSGHRRSFPADPTRTIQVIIDLHTLVITN